jgi:hypothetical protein
MSRDLKGYYDIPDLGPNVKYPSVTTVLGCVHNWYDQWKVDLCVDWFHEQTVKPFLAGELPIEQLREMDMVKALDDAKLHHKDVSGEAKDFGSRFHKAMDNYHKGISTWETDIIPTIDAAIEWERIVMLNVLESEHTVYSQTFQYAGTMDVYAEARFNDDLPPITGVIDFKVRNGKGGKAIPVYATDKEQIAAYVLAKEEMLGRLLDWGGILIINRESKKVEPHIYMRPQLIKPGMEFLALNEYFKITHSSSTCLCRCP